MTLSPPILAVVSAVLGSGLAVGGVFVLAGLGWALIAGAVPLIGLAAVLIRGLVRG